MEHINKNRSFSSCIREGYRLFQGNMRNIVVSSWKELTGASLLFAATLTSWLCFTTPMVTTALAVLFVACFVLFKARIFDMLDYRSYWWNIRRMGIVIPVAVVAVALVAAPLAARGWLPVSPLASWAIVGGVSFVIACLMLPLLHVCLDIMMNEKPSPAKAYKTGLRRWGFLFLTVLLSMLICAIIFAIVWSPLAISIHSALADKAGIALGDPSGLPTYFPYLLFGTAALTFFATLYIQTWQTFAMAFAYGSLSYKNEQQ